MKTNLNFEDKSTKELLSKLDFEYFLTQNIQSEKYNEEEVKIIYENFNIFNNEIQNKAKKNKKQFFYYCEGQVRKMFNGGLLPAIFELDEGRRLRIVDFPATGENWAYFQYWRKIHKKKIRKEKIWNYVIKIGSILAFILTIFKLYEILSK
jgi:hypothetical protein|tara:strand:- start:684 stop:1136 length:453 start_codon:yes stop_codon:yes gene_type:complete